MSTPMKPGLEGVIAAETRLSLVDGERGELTIAGFPVSALAENASFEEVVALLWELRLPNRRELDELSQALVRRRTLPRATVDLLRAAAGSGCPAMDALRMGASSLGVARGSGAGDGREDALHLVAAFPTLVATYWRLRNAEEPLEPDPGLGHAANYLFMLSGEVPDAARVRALETYLNTVVDHGMNASTFTARVIISTRSDLVSAVVGAVGALKGPLHGGAPGPALDTVLEIASPQRAETVLRQKLAQGHRLMGFGHRVYRVGDPRAEVLAQAARRLLAGGDQRELYDLAMHVEKVALRLLEERKPGRKLQTNVEYYTALLLHGIGLPTELFTPTFALSRVAGWTAHCFEQQRAQRLIRPRAAYVGERDREWVPLTSRPTGPQEEPPRLAPEAATAAS